MVTRRINKQVNKCVKEIEKLCKSKVKVENDRIQNMPVHSLASFSARKMSSVSGLGGKNVVY